MIQVVMLAGGRGERLMPATNDVCKPMVLVKDKPFLEYLVRYLYSLSFTHILFLVGYLGEQIEHYFGNGERFGVTIQYSYEQNPLGTGGALKNAEDRLDPEFLLLNADTYLPIDYYKVIEVFNTRGTTGLIVACTNDDVRAVNNMSVVQSGIVSAYNKKNHEVMTHVDAGVIVLKKEILRLIPEKKMVSLEEEIYPQLIRQQQLAAYITHERFYDMGTMKGLTIVTEILP
ncbi:MAG: NTP transferase domain-containing protein [Candidatus Omnitrophica bacterium]|nr:NTP transferase domain-containing protein [Candidatus Omnitrophota bacterium]